jgi:hypothetical protein
MPDETEFPLRNPADAKAWFYLERRADIEDWAAQREDAAALLVRYLRVLETPLSEMAGDVSADFDLDSLDDGKFRVMGLRRPQWSWQGVNDVAVTMEWDPKTLLSPSKENPWPFVAVRHSGDRERFKILKAALAPAVKRLGGSSQHPWAYWRFQKPSTRAVDPQLLAEDLIAGFRQLWEEAAPMLDKFHQDPTPRPPT